MEVHLEVAVVAGTHHLGWTHQQLLGPLDQKDPHLLGLQVSGRYRCVSV